jgi:SagB-type dehydrogenase family enzyme
MKEITNNRNFMKSYFGSHKGMTSDQMKGKPYPPLQKPYDEEGAEIIDLPEFDKSIIEKNGIFECIKDRRSIRNFTDESLTKEELSYLLWATQGVGKIIRDGYATLRTVPSAGARHPFETYIIVDRIKEIEKGVYRYLALTHQLLFLFTCDDIPEKLNDANLGQKFVGDAPLVFVWSCIPYRTEWRYSIKAHKAILLDAGHVCQNLYLAAESIGCGTCAIGAYDQKAMDDLLELDGNDEFVVYLAPVGRFKH